MNYLFTQQIASWNDWGDVFQNIGAFTPIIEKINKKHGIPERIISHLPPGTNAVFKAGGLVYKIFAPTESGFDSSADFECERKSIANATKLGINTSEIVCHGEIADKYLFRYIVLKYIEGYPAGSILPSYLNIEKATFAEKLKHSIYLMSDMETHSTSDDVIRNVRENKRWSCFPQEVHEWVSERASMIDYTDSRYVHGDLTGENVIINTQGQGNIYIIDFADCQTAPEFYDWPPIFFCLFKCDPILTREFFADYGKDGFIEQFTDAMLIHDFGGDFARDLCRELSVDCKTIRHPREFLPLIVKKMYSEE